jgi:hypothetical protein
MNPRLTSICLGTGGTVVKSTLNLPVARGSEEFASTALCGSIFLSFATGSAASHWELFSTGDPLRVLVPGQSIAPYHSRIWNAL